MTKIDDAIARAADEERLIQQAVQLQQTGDLPRADLIYQQILQRNPRHGDALNLRGLLAYQAGKVDNALTLIKAAIGVVPKSGQYFANLAFMQEVKGDLDNAERSFKKAVKYQPNHAEAWNNYATLLQKQNRLEEAESAYCEAIAKAPDYLQAYYNLGVMLINCGAFEKAASIFKQALVKMPDNPDLLLHYGVSLQGDGKLAEATAAYEKILIVAPEHPGALVNLASVAMAEDNMIAVRDYAKRAIAAAPDHIGAWNNLGNAYLALGEHELAKSAYEFVLSKIPDEAEVHGNLANVFKNMNRLDEAEAHYRKAAELAPNDARHNYQLSLLLKMRGKFRESWLLFEAGFACGERFPAYSLDIPRWQGQQLGDDETLLIWGEQGIGDELLMASLFGDTIKRASNCVISCEPRLVELFERSFPDVSIIPTGSATNQTADYQVPAGGLFEYYRNTLEDFPKHNGFLTPSAERVAEMKKALSHIGDGLKVGIAWDSGLKTSRRLSALTKLEDWSSVLSIPNVSFVNLQYDADSTAIQAAEVANNMTIHQIDGLDLKQDIDGVAALVASLDLVISIGTSVYNIAAGVGVETWVLVRKPKSLIEGLDYLPNYPKVRVFSKIFDQSWDEILPDVAQALRVRSGI